MKLSILIALVLTAIYALCAYGQMPPLPLGADDGSVLMVDGGTNEPITSTIAWDAQDNTDVFSVVIGGTTNLTTGTNITVTTPPGTNTFALRAHKGTNASGAFVTNLVVAVNTVVDHWPETSGSVLGPWKRRTFGTFTNPVESVQFVRVGQSLTVSTNREMR